eukprot:5498308-Amphidinium_carterae.1
MIQGSSCCGRLPACVKKGKTLESVIPRISSHFLLHLDERSLSSSCQRLSAMLGTSVKCLAAIASLLPLCQHMGIGINVDMLYEIADVFQSVNSTVADVWPSLATLSSTWTSSSPSTLDNEVPYAHAQHTHR